MMMLMTRIAKESPEGETENRVKGGTKLFISSLHLWPPLALSLFFLSPTVKKLSTKEQSEAQG